MKPNWKKAYATSLRHAMDLCVNYARDKKRLKIEEVAELMALDSHHTLYKWIASGRMPAIHIRSFENVCGIDFVSRYLAHSGGNLLVRIPTGAKPENINDLNVVIAETTSQIAQFYFGDEVEAATVTAAITRAMEGLAYHRANIEKNEHPELELA